MTGILVFGRFAIGSVQLKGRARQTLVAAIPVTDVPAHPVSNNARLSDALLWRQARRQAGEKGGVSAAGDRSRHRVVSARTRAGRSPRPAPLARAAGVIPSAVAKICRRRKEGQPKEEISSVTGAA